MDYLWEARAEAVPRIVEPAELADLIYRPAELAGVWQEREGTWYSAARCRGLDEVADVFFSSRADELHTAKLLCADCPVLDRCRADVDAAEDGVPYSRWYGVWAGEEPWERRQRRKRERAKAARGRSVARRAGGATA